MFPTNHVTKDQNQCTSQEPREPSLLESPKQEKALNVVRSVRAKKKNKLIKGQGPVAGVSVTRRNPRRPEHMVHGLIKGTGPEAGFGKIRSRSGVNAKKPGSTVDRLCNTECRLPLCVVDLTQNTKPLPSNFVLEKLIVNLTLHY